MFVLQWLLIVTSPEPIILADAYRFGADYEAARSLRIMCNEQRNCSIIRAQIAMNYGDDGVYYWRRDCDWRYNVWSAIEDALNDKWGESARLARLREVYYLIGPDAYYNGVLPHPNPQYRVLSLDKE